MSNCSQSPGFAVRHRSADMSEKKFGPLTLTKDGEVFILQMISKPDNRFTLEFIAAFHQVLDEIEKTSGSCALVTYGFDRFYHNGLDLEYLGQNADKGVEYLNSCHDLFRRVLLLGIPTVAAINGHAYAGGCMLALSHDFRVMRSDRGFLCFPEIDLNMSLPPPMAELIKSKIGDPKARRDAMLFGKKFTATEALKAGLIDQVVEADKVVATAVALVKQVASKGANREVLASIKETTWSDAAEALKKGISTRGKSKL